MPIAVAFFIQYAYGILFLWVLLEQLGIPIPSIPLLLTAGTLSATRGLGGAPQIHASLALLAVVVACFAADSLWYFMGRRYGGAVLRLLCRLSLEASTCVKKTEGFFVTRGPVTLLFAKFIPGLSTVAAPIAGQTGMPYLRFIAFDIAGSTIYCGTFLLIGHFFGDLAMRIPMVLGLLARFAFGIFVLMVLGFMLQRVLRQRKFLAETRALRLEPAELMEMIDQAEAAGNIKPFIVDLRHPLDYLPDPRVVPGAVRVGPADLAAHQDRIPRDRDVILYCTCPSEETSSKVALQLHKMGVYRVRPLRGGFEGWRDAGLPLVDYVEPVEVPLIAAVHGDAVSA